MGRLSPFADRGGPCRQNPTGLQLVGQQQWEQGLACSIWPLQDNSAEGNFPDVGLCSRASNIVGLLWFYVTVGRTTATSSTGPKVLGGVEKQKLIGEAKPWCCAHLQPARSNLLERLLNSLSPISRSMCDIAEKLNGMDKKNLINKASITRYKNITLYCLELPPLHARVFSN